MRIGVEMFGTQTSGRDRGIGRYARNLAAALRTRGESHGHSFTFYAVDGLPTDRIPTGSNAETRQLRPEPHLKNTLTRLVHENPDRLDALLFINPLEMCPGLDIPARRPDGACPRLFAVCHDLIPFVFQDDYLRHWPATTFARRYLWGLGRLQTYERLLTNSEATRADLLHYLNMSPERVVTIGAAGDDHSCGFTPDASDSADDALLAALGVSAPFVLTVAGPDSHKNLDGLFAAFAALPEPIRETHALVVVAGASDPGRTEVARRTAARARISDRIVLMTRLIDDLSLRALYRRCAVFAFPSRYEGFGLPVLEALACGAAVVAGNASSLPEVTGEAAVLVDVADPFAFSAALAAVLTDATLARSLRARGPARAATFSWDAVAERALAALVIEKSTPTRVYRTSNRQAPRIAFVSPLPPETSGVADYAAALADALAERAALDFFHDQGRYPFARFRRRDAGCFDHRLFDRFQRVRPYDGVLYQMGNSPVHDFIFDMLEARPGVVVLHDLALASFHYERATRSGGGRAAFRAVLAATHPDREAEFDALLNLWDHDPSTMVRTLTEAGFDMNAGVVAAARTVVVHSQAAADRLGSGAAGKVVVIPHGAAPADQPPTPLERLAARTRLGLPGDALIVGNFGIVHETKLNAEAIEAFAALAQSEPSALLLVVGVEADGGHARRAADTRGLSERVRFLGRADDDRFRAAIVACDLALALRRPPTNGETSGALLHVLRAGIPAIASATGSFAEYPEGSVHKIPWPDARSGVASLARALRDLAADPAARAALGRAGLEHARQHHAWPRVAARFAALFAAPQPVESVYHGPHRAPEHVLESRRGMS